MVLRVLSLIGLLFVTSTFAEEQQFIIGVGDTIIVDVYNEKDLFVRAKINQSGMLRVPLIGNVKAVGKTPKQLGEELEVAFDDGYLVNPSVTVSIEAYRPIFVNGAVKSAGAYEFVFNLTVEQAIAIAGGLKDRASQDKWFVQRGDSKEKIRVNRDSKVLPGDIITIEESIF